MFGKNKNGKNKVRRKINNKFLNNKKYREEVYDSNSEYLNSSKKKSYIKNDINIGKEIYEIPGYYYDKNTKRYFLININEPLNIKNNDETKLNNEPKIKNVILSNFKMVHSCKIMDKKILKKKLDRVKSLKDANLINIEYTGNKFPNDINMFYPNKYLFKLDYFSPNADNNNNLNNNFVNIIIHDVINNKFIKKIVIEEFYNDFTIKENNLILIDNITKISIINNINEIIESKEKKIFINFIKKFNIRVDNIERISMVYKWPFINITNNYTFYYLIWNNFYYFDISEINNIKDKLTITNSDIIYLSKKDILYNKIKIKINKVNIDKRNHYINFFINTYDSIKHDKSPYFYFFTINGEIHCYKFNKNNTFQLKQIITNEILDNIQIINIIPFRNESNYLILSNQNDIFNLNIKNQTMTKVDYDYNKNNENKRIKYKIKIFKYIEDLNCLIFDDDNLIKILSLDDFTFINKFLYNDYKYNILTINNSELILI